MNKNASTHADAAVAEQGAHIAQSTRPDKQATHEGRAKQVAGRARNPVARRRSLQGNSPQQEESQERCKRAAEPPRKRQRWGRKFSKKAIVLDFLR